MPTPTPGAGGGGGGVIAHLLMSSRILRPGGELGISTYPKPLIEIIPQCAFVDVTATGSDYGGGSGAGLLV